MLLGQLAETDGIVESSLLIVREVHEVFDDLREAGAVGENAQPIIFVVREKRRKRFNWKF